MEKIEVLTFSSKQLSRKISTFHHFYLLEGAFESKTKGNDTVTLSFYKGVQFTDRVLRKVYKPSSFDDTTVIYEGEIDETKITYKEKEMYDAHREVEDMFKEKESSEEDYLDGTNEMIAVSRLEKYYSRNNIKTNLDDDEEQ